MSDRPIRGTTDWRFYEIVMDVPLYAQHLSYGFRLAGGTRLFGPRDGRGIAWGDSFQIAVVGKDVPVSAEYLAADYTPPVRLTQNARMRAVADMKERAIFDAWVNRGNTGRDPRSTPRNGCFPACCWPRLLRARLMTPPRMSCVDGSCIARTDLRVWRGWSGAVLCSACCCGAHDRWP